ncbi:hypothetical protein [Celeribacter arenosi]|uniref:Uncharacterized protein n=1 Tax=Celeribacter arenosi TaxID=792649 RepID=A0ABP7KHD9_9RHOB
MTRTSLSQTLTALIDGVTPGHDGLTVQEAHIDLPLIVRMEHGPTGPVFTATPPFSIFHSGFEPVTHRASLRVETIAAAPDGADQPQPDSLPDTGAE